MINSLCDELREDNDLRANLDKCTKKCNFLKKLKKALPSQRKYFSQLRRKMGDTPTSDPQLMAEIAYHFWKDKWTSQGSNYSMIRQVLSTFNRTYSAKLVEIDIDMVCEVIYRRHKEHCGRP